MYFLGINPDEDLPHPSLLTKFRNDRLQGSWLDDIITELVKQCVDKKLIKGASISIDSTHIAANTRKLVPERVMKHLAKKIFKTLGEHIPAEIPTDIPDYKQISDPKRAKEVMRDYLVALIAQVKALTDLNKLPKTAATVEQSERILADPKFIEQKGARSLADEEARVGHKSKTKQFYGYKAETMMTTEERIITAVTVGHGAYVDGSHFEEMLERTISSNIKVKELCGDRAYFKADILRKVRKEKIDPIIPVSASAYRVNEELFYYNKDSDQWFCVQGNETYRRKYYENKQRKQYHYYFGKEQCKACPIRSECMGKAKSVGRLLKVSINANDLFMFSQRTKLPDFKEKFRKRAAHEGKNAELKIAHGLARARGYSLKSVAIQAKLTALAVNLKRIANLATASSSLLPQLSVFLIAFTHNTH
jgi:hypothetical protein